MQTMQEVKVIRNLANEFINQDCAYDIDDYDSNIKYNIYKDCLNEFVNFMKKKTNEFKENATKINDLKEHIEKLDSETYLDNITIEINNIYIKQIQRRKNANKL